MPLAIGLLFFLVRVQGIPSQERAGQIALSCFFSKVKVLQGGPDSLAGRFYYWDRRAFFAITYPLSQFMVIEGHETTVFYPDTRKTFVLESRDPVQVTLMADLLASTMPDYGLSSMGFVLDEQTYVSDTLVMHWVHADKPDESGRFVLRRRHGYLIEVSYLVPGGDGRFTSYFSDHVRCANLDFPTTIMTRYHSTAHNGTETMKLKDLTYGADIPDSVRTFKIPESADIEYKAW